MFMNFEQLLFSRKSYKLTQLKETSAKIGFMNITQKSNHANALGFGPIAVYGRCLKHTHSLGPLVRRYVTLCVTNTLSVLSQCININGI